MDFLRNFIKSGYLQSIGKLETYRIILGASAYFDKGILKEDDLKEINDAINKQYEKNTEETEVIETPIEETEVIENNIEEA